MPFHNRISGQEVQQRIINLMKARGPILPIHVAKDTGLTTILAGAYLSTMLDDKAIKVSNLKVGGSPLYFLAGQEAMLENFYAHLPGKEKEAFFLIKEKKLLQDSELEPAIRIAIRNIRDFAFPFATDEHPGLVFWRFYSFNLEEADTQAKNKLKLLERKQPAIQTAQIILPQIVQPTRIQQAPPIQEILKPKTEVKEEKKPEIKIEVKVEEKKEEKKPAKELKEKQKQLIESKPKEQAILLIKQKKEKPKDTRFLEEVKEFLLSKDIELVQELSFDKKEVTAKARINSDLGKITFLMTALDKKKINEADLIKAYQKALGEKYLCLFVSKASLSKKNLEFLEGYKNLMKVEKIG